ncbi:MAG: Gfo/Idh/MocA family oxidoreductase [Protaetiibacter sp.]
MTELRVALIGGGFMGKAHSLAWALTPISDQLGANVIKQVLVDVNEEVASRQAADLGWAESATDWREVVGRDDIDIIDICTPPQFHADIAIAAADAGKHVFVEKPITNSAEEAIRMAELVGRTGVVAQVGFNYRHAPAVEHTKQLLDSGELGEPMMFRASFLSQGWSGNPSGPQPWRALKATGGSGTVGDIGSHIIDSAEYLFGDIVRVAARARAGDREDGWWPETRRIEEDLIDRAAVWVAEFANGTIGTFAVNGLAAGRKNDMSWQLDATKGAVEFVWNDREEFRIAYVDEKPTHHGFRTVLTSNAFPDGVWPLAGLGIGYADVTAIQFKKFVQRILGEDRITPTLEDATHVQQVVEAVYAAAASERWVDVPARIA